MLRRLVATLGLALALVLLPAGVVVAQTAPPGTATAGPGGTVAPRGGDYDLAALTLTPADLNRPGFVPPFVAVGALPASLGETAGDIAAARGVSPDTVAATLQAAGWQRTYQATAGRPGLGDPQRLTEVVRSSVTEFADARGATSGFAFLQDTSGEPTASRVAGAPAVGDASTLTRAQGKDADTGEPFHSLDLIFRLGRWVGEVTVAAYDPSPPPDQPTIAAFATVLAQRLANPPTPGSTLGGAVLFVGGTNHTLTTDDDAYQRRAGQDIPQFDEDPSAAAARTATYANATDVYQLWQGIDADTLAGVSYVSTLLRFPSPDAASTWVGDLGDVLRSDAYYTALRPLPNVPGLGDQSAAWSFAPPGEGARQGVLIAVQVGADVARVQLVPTARLPRVPEEAVATLAAAQTACLQAMACPQPAPVPAALAAAMAAPLPTPAPTPTPVPATAAAGTSTP